MQPATIPAWLAWARPYPRNALHHDLLAGLTTFVVLVPQALAYAVLAGVPAHVGLIAAVVGPIFYALRGTSPELAVGPVAIDALLVAAAIAPWTAGNPDAATSAAALLALLSGTFGILLGQFGGAFLTNFLSAPVITGFTAGAAVLIAASQVGPLLGIPALGSGIVALWQAPMHIARAHPATAALGLGVLAALIAAKRVAPRFPAPLAAVLGTTLASILGHWEARGIGVVGPLASIGIPHWDWTASDVLTLAPTALLLSFVGFVEAHAITRRYAQIHGIDVDPEREWTALGLANAAVGAAGGMPVTGGLSRTAVNHEAGARTPLAGIISGILVAGFTAVGGNSIAALPRTVLAAVILSALPALVDVSEARRLWRVKRSDFTLMLVAAAATVGLGPLWGLAVGVAASILWFVVRTTRPHAAVLGRLPQSNIYRNIRHYPQARTFAGVLIARIDAQFYFGNISFLKTWLRQREAEMATPLRAVIIEAASINQLDASADRALAEIAADYAARGIALCFANVKMPVYEVMQRSGLVDAIGREHFYLDLPTAVEATLKKLAPDIPYLI